MSFSSTLKWCPAVGALCLSSLAASCDDNPYDALKDESVGLGAVDPVTFPPDNLGADGNRMQPGSGAFIETPAFVGGEAIGYFAYPVNTPPTRDPLRVLDDGKPYAGVATPTAYAFDATDEVPVGDKNACTPAHGGQANPRLDPIEGWYQRQNNVFTDLPKATYMPGVAAASTYVPVVSETRVSSSGHICQDIKSKTRLEALLGQPPAPSGRYLAWLIIDPAAAVYPIDDPNQEGNGLGTQKWGWFNRYLLAYLDGGYIPTVDVPVMGGTMAMPTTKTVKRMKPQKLYVPAAVLDAMTMMPVEGELGQGYDVLAAKRGALDYSPICEVAVYDTKTALLPEMLPKDAQTIETMFGPTAPGTPSYVYCLQVR